ncbi:MAG TPA: sigma-70 family RNA polymerase sigma factor [Acidimicrobiales bacterium]|nr:sigma-70 family RNA polymerase sigma factor [Acidimicrobiales bacterium]
MSTPSLSTEMRRCRRALDRLGEATDRARALTTAPADRVERSCWDGTARRPVVDVDVWLLHVRHARRPDDTTLTELVEHYRAHAESQARHHYRHGIPIDDLTQVAYEALVRAVQRFDPDLGKPFLAFAKPTIVGTLRRHFRDVGWAIRVPRRVHDLAGPTRDAVELLTHDLGRAPTPSEIADFVGVTTREVLDAMTAEEARATSSLDAPDTTGRPLGEQTLGHVDRGFVGIENRAALLHSLEALSDDDRDLLQQYFFEERTQAEIAQTRGCSQMQVSRLLRRAVHQLRRRMLDA